MHLLSAFSLKNRALIALVTIVAAVFGVLSVTSLKQELMPSVQFPAVAVVTSYPGASPEVVNEEVSGPIETALRGVPQLETSTATSSTGSSMVLAEFTYGVDIAATEQKVERAISRISQSLPEASDTQVVSGSIDDFPVIQIAVAPAGEETLEQAAATVERIAIPELGDLEGVREAQLSGATGDRVTIEPDEAALLARGLTAQSITDSLQQSGVLVAAGSVTDGDRTLAVQADSTLTGVDDISALPLALGAEPLTIGDVAEVRLEQNPVQSISRVDGKPALTIAVTKTSAANTVDVSHAVQEQIDDLEDQLGGARLSVVFDQAPYIEQSIETLTVEGLLGLAFAVLVILVFLMSVRATIVTAISIPTSVLLALIGLSFAEYSLNLLTLGALTISIGRVVDDSIVVIENIKRHLSGPGVAADRAATIVAAVREVAGAITASTVTTVAVFLPMAFVSGMVGELFRPFAYTVTIALVASLLVSLTIVPVLAYWFLKPGRSRRRGPESDGSSGWLQRGYRPIIEWTLRRPVVTILLAVVVLGGTLAATPFMKTNFIGDDEQNSVGLEQTLSPGTSLTAQILAAERVEAALRGVSAIETLQVTIGDSAGVGAVLGGGDGVVSYSITTDPDADQALVKDEILAAVEELDDAGDFALGASDLGMMSSSDIEVIVSAPDQQTLEEASDAVVAELEQRDELTQVSSDLAESRPYISVVVDRAAAAAAGLSEAAVAGQLAQQMQPSQIGQITIDESTVGVYLSSGAAPIDAVGVAALPIQTPTGVQPLSALATTTVADGPVTVTTQDGSRVVTVSATPTGDDLGTAGTTVESALDEADLPAGARAEIGGVMSQQSEAFEQLGLALLAAILIVYVVMVATFRSLLQPLLLLVSVPFAATGALLLLIATGIPLGVASLIGVLMLVGIVVTNAIVLIDLVNQYRRRGDGLRDAVLHGTLQRLRPIVMTALATILALTPMSLGITGKGGFISQPLAVVVIGGLLSSTVLTLVVLPTLYFLVERARDRGTGTRLGGSGGPQGPAGDLGIGDPSGAAAPRLGRRGLPPGALAPAAGVRAPVDSDTGPIAALIPAERRTVGTTAAHAAFELPETLRAEPGPAAAEAVDAAAEPGHAAVEPAEDEAVADAADAAEAEAVADASDAADPEPEGSPPAEKPAEPDWEQLMWEATQEAAEEPAPRSEDGHRAGPESDG